MIKAESLLPELKELGIACRTDVCGKDKTSFRIGGRLGVYAEPSTAEELCAAVSLAEESGLRYYVIGNGSNLLISDDGVDALFIRPSGRLCGFSITSNRVAAGAGVSLAALAKATVNSGLMGLEWACGIPGTVGGAVAMNAGAYGGEIVDVIKRVAVIKNGAVVWQDVEPGDMGYRRSDYAFPKHIVAAAEFLLSPDDGFARERMNDYNEKRKLKQPVELPSAGSTFKRPEGLFAAALIDSAGLKGLSCGGACVSPKHAGFIVNNGGATCSDVLELMQIVKQKVFDRFGVELEPEIKIIL